ncbi:MAG: ABC transporter permease, partial [Oscillospiraceae bacterium]|nr:ABC transporter permease [Oscillospiraceae bacterium]
MMLTENIRQAYDSLVINKKRTFLTMTGIVIGLSAVLFITSIGDTVSKLLEDFIVQNLIGGTQVALLSGYDDKEEKTVDNVENYTFSIDEVYDFIDSSNGIILDISENSGADINGTVQVDKDHKADIIMSGVSSAYEVTSKLHIISG